MNKTIKMVGLDLDGTLLTSNKELSEYTRNVLKEAISQGCVVLPATGRPLKAIAKEVLAIPGIQYAVSSNGARIVNVEKGISLYENLLSVSLAERVLEVFEEYQIFHEIFVEGIGYTDEKSMSLLHKYFDEGMAKYILETRTPVKNVKDTLHALACPVDKVQGVFHKKEEQLEAAERLKAIPGITVTSALGNNLEVNCESVDKGMALLKLGELLGIQKEEIMACGDGLNDYEMLKAVGFAVAMGNADEALKEIADYITDTNDNDGVAKAIECFVLNREG